MSGIRKLSPQYRMLIVIELLRWVVIIVPIYLALWRFTELRGYTIFISDADAHAQFWGMTSAIIFGASLLLYLPLKLLTLKYRVKEGVVTGLHWRPSLLTYMFTSAAPVLIIILVAAKMKDRDNQDLTTTSSPMTTQLCDPVADPDVLDLTTTTVLQIMIIGLTLTEWISKIREEHLTYDLVTAMADDFFFAYDVMDFITMATREEDIYRSHWVYICFSFAFIAMFKYVPAQPLIITGQSGPRSQTAILVSMFCCEVPFVTIRLWTMVEFDFLSNASGGDLLHPIKNIMLIIFDIMQLSIINKHKHLSEPPPDISEDLIPKMAPQVRRARCQDPEQDPDAECNLQANEHWDVIRRRLVNKEAKLIDKVSPPAGIHNSGFVNKSDENESHVTGSPAFVNKSDDNESHVTGSPDSVKSISLKTISSGEIPGATH